MPDSGGRCSRECSKEKANFIDANGPGVPALALNNLAFVIAGQLKIDVAIRPVGAAGLSYPPSFASEHLTDKPLEFRGVQQAQIRRPLKEIPSVGKLDPNAEPPEAHDRGEDGTEGIRLNEVQS